MELIMIKKTLQAMTMSLAQGVNCKMYVAQLLM